MKTFELAHLEHWSIDWSSLHHRSPALLLQFPSFTFFSQFSLFSLILPAHSLFFLSAIIPCLLYLLSSTLHPPSSFLCPPSTFYPLPTLLYGWIPGTTLLSEHRLLLFIRTIVYSVHNTGYYIVLSAAQLIINLLFPDGVGRQCHVSLAGSQSGRQPGIASESNCQRVCSLH